MPLTPEDLATALTGFAIGLAAALMSGANQTAEEVLEALANELHELAHRAPGTPAAEALDRTAAMLMASETRR